MNKFIQYSFIFITVLSLVAILSITYLSSNYSYHELMNEVLIQFGKPHLEDKFQQIFPPERYSLIQNGLWIFCILYSIFSIFLIYQSAPFAKTIGKVIKKISLWCIQQRKEIIGLSISEKTLLAILIGGSAGLSFYQICSLDLIYDEIWTFLYFTRHSPIMAIATYPAPNNHVLYSLISSILYQFGVSDLWALRLPVFLFSILSNLFLWLFIKEYFNKTTAFIGLSFFAFCLPISFYGVYGRGYMLLVFFSIVSFWALLKWIEQADEKMPIIVFVTAVVSGFYSIPTFLYVYMLWAVFVGFISLKEKKYHFFRSFVKWSIVSGVLVIFLYSPILVVYGLEHSFSNMSQFKIDNFEQLLYQFLPYIGDVLGFLVGISFIGLVLWVLALIGGGLMWQRSKEISQKYIGWISVVGLLFPMLFYLLQQSQIPVRVWSFEAILLSITLGSLISFLIKKRTLILFWRIVISLTIACSMMILVYTDSFWNSIKNSSKSNAQLSEFLIQQDIKTCFLNYYILKPNLEYVTWKKEKPLRIYMPQKGSVDYHVLKTTDRIDALVIGKNAHYAEPMQLEDSFWDNYTQTYEDEFVTIYQLKNSHEANQ